MIDFSCDYNNGAHPEVLGRLVETNGELTATYGEDVYSSLAKQKIKAACRAENADVFFIAGGTQTNMTVISSLLPSYQGVISAVSGHINCHEAGAVEHAGVKILTLPHHSGKIDADELEAYLLRSESDPSRDHMVFPGMVYISYPTEYGTIYKKAELERLHGVCRAHGLLLFVDGARLGYGLTCGECDITLPELAGLCDVFYIGGTKVGALCGEAVVFPQGAPGHFITQIKQRGAMLAKGRLVGVQFDALFTDGLYFRIAAEAIRQADKMKALFLSKGYGFSIDSPTNQQFIVTDDEQAGKLMRAVKCEFWEKPDDTHTVLRFVTSWATTDEDIARLGEVI